jgi:polyhydroxyalkanoate synthesis repressor PhaR
MQLRPDQMATISVPITIKRYAGQRLYHPAIGAYITLDAVAAIVEDGQDFVVYEASTGVDVTSSVLKSIIIERGSHG